MKKLPQKWFIALTNQEQFNEYLKWTVKNGYLDELHLSSEAYQIPYYVAYSSITNYVGYNNTNMWYDYPEITFEQFKKYVLKEKDMKEEFPKDDFGVIVENNAKEIIDYLVNKGFKNLHDFFCSNNTGMYGIKRGEIVIGPYIKHCNTFSKKYTLNQLKQLDNMKEIIGYKLIKPEYLKAACQIAKLDIHTKEDLEELIRNNLPNSYTVDYLKVAGVLDLWFEPVYKKEEKVISMGSFNLTVKQEGIFSDNEDITSYVRDVYETFKNFHYERKYGKSYDFIIDEIVLKKTGCKSSKSTVKQWINCWEEYLKIKQ